MLRTWLLLVVLSGSLASCAPTPSTPTEPLNTQVVLAPGEVKQVSGAGIRIRFDGVTGDSRCPADAVCIQGGDAIVRISVLPQSGSPSTFDLHTGNMTPARYADLTIALDMLSPYPFSSQPITPDAYRATLRVIR